MLGAIFHATSQHPTVRAPCVTAALAAIYPAIAVTGDDRRRKRRRKSTFTFLLGPSAGKAGKKVPYEEAV